VNYFTLSHDSETCNRSPEISSTAFDTRPPDLPPASLMDTDFAVIGPLVRRRKPLIRFLSIGPYLCSTLPSDATSRRRPCASPSLLLYQDVKRTFTSKLSTLLGVQRKGPRLVRGPFLVHLKITMILDQAINCRFAKGTTAAVRRGAG
jgi:hypothetical protein